MLHVRLLCIQLLVLSLNGGIPVVHSEVCLAGCKMNNINVVYTPWANLKKTGEMDVGQIGFHRHKEVGLLTHESRNFFQTNNDVVFDVLAAYRNHVVPQVKLVAVEKKVNEIGRAHA